ncbi:hypothetical protein J6590_029950 [Homalodisca vitripennis]|nr:hypothetical protein J6590_029950 [Homalodisca vitripennis]
MIISGDGRSWHWPGRARVDWDRREARGARREARVSVFVLISDNAATRVIRQQAAIHCRVGVTYLPLSGTRNRTFHLADNAL